ncbi:MAG: carboxyltransferase domain-containing protein, partial [Candidatus Methylomirabilota bacterium]
MPVRILPAGERGMVVELGESIDLETNAAVRMLALALERAGIPGIRELVPTYRSLGVEYDPEAIGWEALSAKILAALETIERSGPPPGRVVEIPTRYGGEQGPDLADVAAHAG